MSIRIDKCWFQSGIIGWRGNASAIDKNSAFAHASVYAGKALLKKE